MTYLTNYVPDGFLPIVESLLTSSDYKEALVGIVAATGLHPLSLDIIEDIHIYEEKPYLVATWTSIDGDEPYLLEQLTSLVHSSMVAKAVLTVTNQVDIQEVQESEELPKFLASLNEVVKQSFEESGLSELEHISNLSRLRREVNFMIGFKED